MEEKSRRFDVFSIREYVAGKEIKTSWTRVGAAFENRDGSWNLRLHALPLPNPKTGLAELHMREPRPAAPDGDHGVSAATDTLPQDGFNFNPNAPTEHLY